MLDLHRFSPEPTKGGSLYLVPGQVYDGVLAVQLCIVALCQTQRPEILCSRVLLRTPDEPVHIKKCSERHCLRQVRHTWHAGLAYAWPIPWPPLKQWREMSWKGNHARGVVFEEMSLWCLRVQMMLHIKTGTNINLAANIESIKHQL